jgi:hypothetical protein
MTYQVPDLAADADFADLPLWKLPYDTEIVGVILLSEGTASGIDASNTCIVALKVNSTTIALQTYDNTTTFPAKSAGAAIPLAAANVRRAAGDIITLSVTNGSTANPPIFSVQIDFIPVEQV